MRGRSHFLSADTLTDKLSHNISQRNRSKTRFVYTTQVHIHVRSHKHQTSWDLLYIFLTPYTLLLLSSWISVNNVNIFYNTCTTTSARVLLLHAWISVNNVNIFCNTCTRARHHDFVLLFTLSWTIPRCNWWTMSPQHMSVYPVENYLWYAYIG